MTLLTEAIAFAAGAHDGVTRKGSRVPYIVHPMETVAIAASITDDEEVLAAAALHDVIEDCGVSAQTLCEQYGEELVLAELEKKSVFYNQRLLYGRDPHKE